MAERSKVFFQEDGRDVFIDILNRLSLQYNIKAILKLRLVSKSWSELVFCISHLTLYTPTILSKCPFRHFKQMKSISLQPNQLIDSFVIPNIKELCVTYQVTTNEKRSLGNWTLLQKLSIDMSCRYTLEDIHTLTQLTSLSCHSRCFSNTDDLFLLTNLKSLSIWAFPKQETLSDKLPNLSNLVSCSPQHFSSFTGKGILDTRCTSDSKPLVNNAFCHYTPSDRIFAEGKWEFGLFTGSVRFSAIDHHDNIKKCIYGTMIGGKFDGFIKEEDYDDKSGSEGIWKSGKKEGVHTEYTWNFHDRCIPVAYTNWKDGKCID